MSTTTTVTVELDDEGLEELEVHVEVWWDRGLQVGAMGLHPENGLTGIVSKPFRNQKVREGIQEIIDNDQNILDQCALALAEAERMSA